MKMLGAMRRKKTDISYKGNLLSNANEYDINVCHETPIGDKGT